MKFIYFVILNLFIAFPLRAQEYIYLTDKVSEAQRDVIFVSTPTNADMSVNVVSSKTQLHLYKNSWYFTTRKSEATMILREVRTSNGNRKALRVYRNDPPVNTLSNKWKPNS